MVLISGGMVQTSTPSKNYLVVVDINVTAEIYVHNEIDTLRNVLTSINPTDEKQAAKPPNLPDDKLTTPRCNGLKEITDFPPSALRTIFCISSKYYKKHR
ncbi:MAG: hypothetical protein ACLR4Z_17795 [Butyricicoccaceae bacterium]